MANKRKKNDWSRLRRCGLTRWSQLAPQIFGFSYFYKVWLDVRLRLIVTIFTKRYQSTLRGIYGKINHLHNKETFHFLPYQTNVLAKIQNGTKAFSVS